MKNLDKFIVLETSTIRDVMAKIARNNRGIVFVCENDKLLATVTDGDIRRYLLTGGGLDDKIAKAAHYSPVYVYEEDRENAETIMKKAVIMALPVVDRHLKLQEVIFLNHFKFSPSTTVNLNVPVIIMAGGKGTRLKPFTDILPKPLIPLEEKTITEHIMERFSEYGCAPFYMIVNYKKNFIKSYFSDNEKKYDLIFVDEKEFLGTAGGLKLLQGRVKGDFFVSNCDIMIEADYQDILAYHRDRQCMITMVCAKKNYRIPYGTVEADEKGYVKTMQEKPDLTYNVNTGLYVVNEKFLHMITEGSAADMTDLINKCLAQKENVGIYLIDEEQWLDIGQIEELQRTQKILDIKL